MEDLANGFRGYSALTAHGLALVATKAAVAPFDRWRVLRQVFPSHRNDWVSLLRKGWIGFIPHASHALLFTSMNLGSLALFEMVGSDYSFASHLFASSIATTLCYPLDVRYTVRTTLAPVSRTFFSGYSLCFVSVPVSVISSLAALSFLSLIFPLPDPNAKNIDLARGVAVGSVSALFGSAVVYPIDTIRRRMIYSQCSVVDAMKSKRLYSGLSIHLFKSIPEFSVLTFAYLANLRYWASSNL